MALKKITTENIKECENLYVKDRYVSNPFYILCCGYFDEGYSNIFLRDEIYPNEFPFLGLPKDKKEWKKAIIAFASEKELEKIKEEGIKIKNVFQIGEEFYYKTEDLIKLEGEQFHNFRKAVGKFRKNYNFKILNNYPKDKIIEFINNWANQQKEKNEMFEKGEDYAKLCVQVKDKIPEAKWVFIEVDNKLAGYCCSMPLSNNLWVGLHLKVDYSYKGLSRFLMYERVKQFPSIPFFTLGSGVDEGVKSFKESLHPTKKEKRYFIITE